MAEIWAAGLITAGVGLYSANQAKKGAQGATNAATAAANADIAERQRQFDIAQANQQPFIQAGQDAVARQQAFLNGDRSGFENSPDYQFRLQQSLQAQERGAAARGGFMGGGADADRIALAQGLAGQAADNYWAKLAGQAGQGYNSSNSLALSGQNFAQGYGNAQGNIADARASSYATNANANSQMAAGIGNLFGQWYGSNQANNPGGTGWYLGNQPGKG